MWNEKHNAYGWNLDRQQSEIKEAIHVKSVNILQKNFLIVNYLQFKVLHVAVMGN